jgi:hypothetical protein
MKKSDLRNGMTVELATGDRRLVMMVNRGMILMGEYCSTLSDAYREDLTNTFSQKLDIVKVYKNEPTSLEQMLEASDQLLWRREDNTKEISASEAFRVLKEHYGCDVKIMED